MGESQEPETRYKTTIESASGHLWGTFTDRISVSEGGRDEIERMGVHLNLWVAWFLPCC